MRSTETKKLGWECWGKGRDVERESGSHWLAGRDKEKADAAVIPASLIFYPSPTTVRK